MSDNNNRIIAKVKKLLELAKGSTNEHEAAQALKQAQGYMAKYDISEIDIDLASIGMSSANVKARMPQKYQAHLIHTISGVFGVENVWCQLTDGTSDVQFIGVTPRPELAKYCWEVLFPKLKNARSDFLKTVNTRCSKSTKTARGDAFAEAWVIAIHRQVEMLSIDDNTKALIRVFTEKHNGEITTTTTKSRKTRNDSATNKARWAGFSAGSQESIHSPVNGREQPKIGAL